MGQKVKSALDDTTWEFGRLGWWVLHIVALVVIGYLGFMFWPR